MFELCVNEARFGLARVLPTLLSFNPQTVEVLEVGAGPCILAAYLASKGLRVTAVEPLGQEFDFLADLQGRVLEFCRGNSIELNLVRTEGEQLDLPSRFDLAFTINSLEHARAAADHPAPNVVGHSRGTAKVVLLGEVLKLRWRGPTTPLRVTLG